MASPRAAAAPAAAPSGARLPAGLRQAADAACGGMPARLQPASARGRGQRLLRAVADGPPNADAAPALASVRWKSSGTVRVLIHQGARWRKRQRRAQSF